MTACQRCRLRLRINAVNRFLQVGFKLFGFELRVASRLVWKKLNGAQLSRRERRQLTRTSADIFRVIPFSLFIIIPFAEVLLPVALRLFPNMLPSTFETPLKQVMPHMLNWSVVPTLCRPVHLWQASMHRQLGKLHPSACCLCDC